jgi:hypothetical protein
VLHKLFVVIPVLLFINPFTSNTYPGLLIPIPMFPSVRVIKFPIVLLFRVFNPPPIKTFLLTLNPPKLVNEPPFVTPVSYTHLTLPTSP